jgi:hypothetical protein
MMRRQLAGLALAVVVLLAAGIGGLVALTVALPAPPVEGPVVHRGDLFFRKLYLTTGGANSEIQFGDPGDTPLLCDWDARGGRQLGVHRGNVFYLDRDDGVVVVPFGDVGDTPLCGDWDGDGRESIGVRRGNRWFLSNAVDPGASTDYAFAYGDPGDTPVVGDWDGNKTATPGVRRGVRWFLRNELSTGVAQVPAFDFGERGDAPVIADWDGATAVGDSVGVFRAGTWLYRITNTSGPADGFFRFGGPGDRPLINRERR